MDYYKEEVKEVFRELASSEKGLSEKEAEKRLEKYGRNEITQKKKISKLKIFINQFKSFLILILVLAVIISAIVGYTEYLNQGNSLISHFVDSIVILIIIILNALFGFFQEFKAEKSIEALKKLGGLKCKVFRDGKIKEIFAYLVVPGDILVLEEGDKVGADAKLLEEVELNVDESLLTGESVPVSKNLNLISKNVVVAERKNMIFSNTIITRGRGRALVVKTGMDTEVGKIAHMIQETEEGLSPLQKKLQTFSKYLGLIFLAICFIVFLVGLVRGFGTTEMLLIAVSLAVAAIPEGLPAVVTITLALGVQRMVKRNALIRKLNSVEALGSVDVICSDKTGTLTCNEMTVRKVFFSNDLIDVTGVGYKTKGEFYLGKQKYKKNLTSLLSICANCNNATLDSGDPTERALMVLAAKGNIKADYKRVSEIPFDSKKKYMVTKNKVGKDTVELIKGAPEVVLNMCDSFHYNNKVLRLSGKQKSSILNANEEMAKNALRVLGMAYKKRGKVVFVGLAGMIDPPRKSVKESILLCKQAGIRTVMITGDHKLTAKAIADKIGIKGKVLEGIELDKINDKKLRKIVEETGIYARVSPEHKVRILEALKKNKHIVAMTGDGVNDAPALKDADIGVAMGLKGTDVAKEASEMVLVDDHFSSIVNAIEEGRGIYSNIQKFVRFLLSSNFGEILVIFIAILIGMPLPLLAVQILWMNLVTDGLPALALGVEPVTKDIMKKKPKDFKKGIVDLNSLLGFLFVGVIMCVGTLILFGSYLDNLMYAQTIAFSTLIMFQMFHVFNSKTVSQSLISKKFFSNKKLIYAVLLSISLQFLVVYSPLNVFFSTVYLTLFDWIKILLVSSSVFFIIEIKKYFVRRRIVNLNV